MGSLELERQRSSDLLEQISRGISAEVGDRFFAALVNSLSSVLQADLAFVGRILPEQPDTVETVAASAFGEPADNFTYPLAGSPCADVLQQGVCVYPDDAHLLYPDDLALVEAGIRGYVGTTLTDARGKAMGILVVLYKRPVPDTSQAERLVKIFAARAAGELDRLAHERMLRQLSQVVEKAPAGVVITDVEGRIEYANDALLQRMGYRLDELIGQNPRVFKCQETPSSVYEELWSTIKRGEIWRGELRNRAKDGRLVHESQVIAPIRDEQGALTHFVAMKEDVSQLKISEQALLRSNRMLRTLSECNQSLVRSRSESELLESICRILVEEGGYPFVWVGYADGAQAANIAPVACWGAENACLSMESDAERGAGPSGRCLRERALVIDAQSCSTRCPAGADSGCRYQVSVSLPVLAPDQQVSGVLRLYSDDPQAFDAEEQALLRELAEDLAFGIKSHRTRQALSESETRFRSLAEDSRVGIYMIQESRFVYVNPQLAEIFGYTPEQVVDRMRVPDLVAEENRQMVAENLQRRFAGDVKSLHYQFTGVRSNGDKIIVEVFGSKTQVNGKPAVVGTLLDVTDRELAEERLRLMSRALEASINGIAISDLSQPDKPFVYVNPAFERITGYSADEVLGRNGRFLLGDDQEQSEVEKIRLALRERRAAKLELRHYHKSGSLFWNELSLAPVDDDAGNTTHYVSIFNDVTERKHYEQQLEKLSNYDSLTGLANKNLLRDRLQQSLIHSQRFQRNSALLMINLDRFKLLNQSLGSLVTDGLLRSLADRFNSLIRQGDTVARTGSDEFAIVLHDLGHEDDIAPIVANIRAAIAQPMSVGVEGMTLTASIGISVSPRDGQSAEEVMLNAEAAMLKAMEEHDCFRFYTPEMNARALDRLDLEVQLRQACERGEFILHYQPKVDLVSGRIVGSEALIRWLHPQRGMVPPFEFIPLAEETGLIREIGAWALREACRQTAQWRSSQPDLTIAVNLSAHQFNDASLADQVELALLESGLAPQALECELTESMLMRDPEDALKTLKRLTRLGVRVALDDFGTGYSSLSYLKRFPIDTLKIDRSFVKDIPDDSHDMAISKAVIALACSLDLYVVAEGVETQEQLDFLRHEGCPAMQGFFFSRPLPGDDFFQLVSSGRGLDS